MKQTNRNSHKSDSETVWYQTIKVKQAHKRPQGVIVALLIAILKMYVTINRISRG